MLFNERITRPDTYFVAGISWRRTANHEIEVLCLTYDQFGIGYRFPGGTALGQENLPILTFARELKDEVAVLGDETFQIIGEPRLFLKGCKKNDLGPGKHYKFFFTFDFAGARRQDFKSEPDGVILGPTGFIESGLLIRSLLSKEAGKFKRREKVMITLRSQESASNQPQIISPNYHLIAAMTLIESMSGDKVLYDKYANIIAMKEEYLANFDQATLGLEEV